MDLLLLDVTSWADEFIKNSGYLGPFVILLLCGVGLPLPEEVTLIASGLLLYQGKVEFVPITVVCSLAILLGDTIPYLVGRRYGKRALRWRLVARVLHPERFAIVEEKFARHGSWMVFFCRFLPGIRIPAYFTAGTLQMSYLRFVILDGLGVLISVPTSIWIAKAFGGQVEKMKEQMANFHLILAFALVALLSIVLFRVVVKRRERQAQALRGAPAASEDAPGAE